MKYLDALGKLPMRSVMLFVLTAIVFFAAMEGLTWGQKIIEYLIGMEATQ